MRLTSPFLSTTACLISLMFGIPSALAQPSDDEGDSGGEGDSEDDEEEEGEEGEESPAEAEETPEAAPDQQASDETKLPDGAKPKGDGDETNASDKCVGDSCPEEAEKELAADGKKHREMKKKRRHPLPGMEALREKLRAKKRENASRTDVAADEADNEEAVAAVLTDLPPQGPSLTPLRVTTSTLARLEIREGYDDLGVETPRRLEGDAVFYRARLGVETNPLPVSDGADVSIKLSPQATGMWGQTGEFIQPNFGMYEGYMHFRSERLESFVGRQKIDYGEGIIFGAVNWHHVGRAYDGVKFHYKMDKGYLDLLGLQTAEVHPEGRERLLGGDEYIWGVYSGFGGYVGDDIETDAYLIGRSTIAQDLYEDPASGDIVTAEGGTLFTLGARVKHKVDWLDYRFEGGVQFGETARSFRSSTVLESPAAFAYQVSGEIGFSMGAATHLSVGGDIASGDDLTTRGNEGWDPLFATGWGWLGNMDVIGFRTNVLSGNLKLTRLLTESLTLHLDGHIFARPERGGLGQVGDEKLAGTEVDARLNQKLGKYARIQGTYGLFIPQSGHYATDDLASYGELEARVEF